MNKIRLFFLLLFAFVSSASLGQPHSGETNNHGNKQHIILNANKLVWKNGPASLPAGARMVMLEGDLSAAGPFTIRLMLPANYRVGPHFHPAIEHVTVIEGAFHMGTGREYNEAAATAIKKGGFAVMPVEYPHFAFTRGKTIIQLHGMGPWGITYINDADDPRKKK